MNSSLAGILRSLFRTRPVYGLPGSRIIAVPATLPAGTVGEDYPAFQLRHRGGTPGGAVRWGLSSGSTLGIGFDDTGLLGGGDAAPSGAGTGTFYATVTDLTTGQVSEPVAYSLTAAEALMMVPAPAPDGVVGVAYSYTFQATGGRAPRTFALAAPLPAWASWNAATGAVTGTPTASGPITLSAFSRDVDGRQTAAYTTSPMINAALAITTASIGTFAAGDTITGTLAATGLVGSPTWSVAGATGLTVNPSTGALGGSVATAGDYTVTATVVDGANGRTATRSLALSITAVAAAPVITTSSLAPGTTSVTYDVTLAATPGTSGVTYWTIRPFAGTTGAPPGWSLDLMSGRLYGTTTAEGDYTIRVRATDESDAQAYHEVTLSVRVRAVPAVTQPAAQDWTVGEVVSLQLVASGYGALTFARISGSWPSGISMNSSGLVSGTVGAEFSGAPVRVSVTDPDGRASIITVSMAADSPIVVTSDPWPTATVGTLFTSPTPVQTGSDLPLVWSAPGAPASVVAGLNTSTGVVSYTPGAGDIGTRGITLVCTDNDGDAGTVQVQHVVEAAASAPVVNPIADVTGIVGSQIVIPFSASGGDPPYTTWETQDPLPTGFTIETLGDGTGRIIGTRSSALTATSISVRCTDDSSNVASYVSFTLTVTAAPTTASDHDFIAALPGVRIAERFDTPESVHGYGFGSIYRNDPNRLTNLDPAYLQWVGPTHPDAAVRKPGHTGCMKFYIPSTVGESSFAWARMFDDSWAVTDGDGAAFTKGLGEGNVDNEAWVAFDVEITAEWCLDYGGGGGPKLVIFNRIAAHNDENEGQMYLGNGNHRDVLQGVCDGGYGFHDPDEYRWRRNITVSGVQREVLQPGIDHAAFPAGHPASLPAPAQGTQAYDDWRYGGVMNFAPSDTTGAIKFTRDMVGKKVRIMMHFRMGTWGNPDSVWETFVALPGRDYLRPHYTDRRLFDLATETLSGFRNDAYGSSGAISGTSCPGGGWPINMIHILHQETGRSGTVGNPAKVFYVHGYYTRFGSEGIPAPGFTVPPQSRYVDDSNEPPPAGVTILSSVVNTSATIAAATPAEWLAEAAGAEIVTPYSELAYDHLRNIVFAHGGGHLTDSHFNGLMMNPRGNAANWAGWSCADYSPVAALRPGTAQNFYTYGDDKPAAVHTYRSTAVSNNGNYWRIAGSVYSSGNNVPYLWEFDHATARWIRHAVPAGILNSSYFGPHLVHDWINDLLIAVQTEGSANTPYATFNPTTKQWSSVRTVGFTCGLVDSNQGHVDLCRVNGEFRLVVCGQMRTAGRQSVMVWTGSAFGARQALTASGAQAASMHTSAASGFAWDRELECWWGWSPNAVNRVFKGVWTSATNIDWDYRDFTMAWSGNNPNQGHHKIFPVTGAGSLVLYRNTTEAGRLIDKW